MTQNHGVPTESPRTMRRNLGWALLVLTVALAVTAGAKAAAAPTEQAATQHDKAKSAGEKPNAMHHVVDSAHWEFFSTFDAKWHLPKAFGFQFTKFMVLELVAAVLVAAVYIPLANRLRTGQPPRGAWDNAFESLLTFIRNEVARPSLGEHDADRFLPFLWTLFLFILFNNLLGMIPFGGSPTASIYVTGALAVCVFFAIHGSAIAKMGLLHYLKTLWPHAEIPFVLALIFKPLIFVIEVVGILVRNAVLAVRLFANMFAGHMVLATILLFVVVAAETTFALWASITFASVLGIVTLSLLELFVAFLQAYIFVFLTALFMGMALHPQH